MLRVEGLSVRYGTTTVLDGVDIEVPDGQVVAVLGPSGCGKTTLLRAVAGLEPAAEGAIYWDERALNGVPPHERGFGLMFQEYALFPHKSVFGNVSFGLRMERRPSQAIAARVAEVLEWVGLEGYGSRSVGDLSGGEQQRVALARALAPAPRMLMLDEPLGSLDRSLRERLVVDLRRLLTERGITAMYVTHDQEEAFAVSDSVLVMRAGNVEQRGPAEEVWRHPVNEWVARFLGFGVIVDAEIEGGVARLPWGDIPLRAECGTVGTGSSMSDGRSAAPRSLDPLGGPTPIGTRRLVLRPDALSLNSAGAFSGVVLARAFKGGNYLLRVRVADGSDVELETGRGALPRVGDVVRFDVDPEGVTILAER
ncbi:MAG: ABC transporter ATP-binding protein [Thermoleophilia bacterium]